jgi:peptidoglycan/LPS O-acetylase OafA/YrhL
MPVLQTVPDRRGTHIVALDVWRGIAISILLIGHFFPVPRLDFGSLGVELFFVLSGYLIGRLLFLSKPTPLGVFYRRRISRIFRRPNVYLAVTLCAPGS